MNENARKENEKLLRAMHEIMKSMNDEGAYDSWILWMPDEPSDEDFEGMADDVDDVKDGIEKFIKLIKIYGDDGIVYMK